MRNKYRVVFNPCTRAFTLQRQSFFGWWRFVDLNGEVYHHEHFSRGGKYDTFASRARAEHRAELLVARAKRDAQRDRDSRTWTRK